MDDPAVVSFDVVAQALAERIDRHARTQRVPGLEPDDIAAEMMVCLWRAWQTYDPGQADSLERWWWTTWLNRRADIIARHNTQKRALYETVVMDDMTLVVGFTEEDREPPTCPDTDPVVQQVWRLLSLGLNAKEVREQLRLSVRAYYRIIEQLKTDVIRSLLS